MDNWKGRMIGTVLVAILSTLGTVTAQGNIEGTDSAGGNTEIHVTSTAATMTITKVWHWDPITEDWDDITSNIDCIRGNDTRTPIVELGHTTTAGHKYKITFSAGSGDATMDFTQDSGSCVAPPG